MARVIQETTTDTVNLDTNIYSTITAAGVAPVVPSFGVTSTKSAGIVKLVNMFIKLLYTLKGTNYLDKSEGTYFTNLFTLNVQDSSVAQSKVQDAIDDATEQIVTVQASLGVPNTEKLKSVTITTFVVNADNDVEIGLTLEVLSGSATQVQLPSITLD